MNTTKRTIDRLVAGLEKWNPNKREAKSFNREKATKYIVDHLKSIRFGTDAELHELVQVLEAIERRNND